MNGNVEWIIVVMYCYKMEFTWPALFAGFPEATG